MQEPADEGGTPARHPRRRLRVVLNPRAGGPDGRIVARLEEALAAAGIDADVVSAAAEADVAGAPPGSGVVEGLPATAVRDRAGFAVALRAAARHGDPVVGVAGGDGSVRAAAQQLAGTPCTLAVFPTGTLNNFSRSLGIDSLERAALAVAAGRTASISVPAVNGVVFLNTATFGLYADVVRRRERLRRFLGKWPAALVGFLVTIARYTPVHFTLEIEGRRLQRESALVRVAVGRDSFPVVDASPAERRAPDLEVTILRARTRTALVALGARTAWRILAGRGNTRDRAVEVLHAHAFSLRSAHYRIGATLDGDIVALQGPLDVGIRAHALRVLVAADA